MPLTDYRTLGRSGLIVSPMALGTMTFGTARWGMEEPAAQAVLDAYLEAGGNFIDTADVYAGGLSEEMLGRLIAGRGLRQSVVLATKAGFCAGAGWHSGGSGARHLVPSLEGSLRRLQTDVVDLFWLHTWDGVTPAEEVLETMAGLVRAGKIRHWGISNAPAWFAARLATLAALRGQPSPIAFQYFYSLVNRDIEDEHLPLAAEAGMAMMPWSPLAFGLLTGKYDRAAMAAAAPRPAGLPRDAAAEGATRPPEDRRLDGANPFGDTLFTERNWRITEVLRDVAKEAGETPARIALAWVMGRPGVTSTLMGVSRAEQVAENIASMDFVLTAEHRARLDAVSLAEPRLLYSLFTPQARRQAVFGGADVAAWRPG